MRLRIDLGYGLLLKQDVDDVVSATEADIAAAVERSIPKVWPLFFSFRIMVGCGLIMLFVFVVAFYQSTQHRVGAKPWLLKLAVCSVPLPSIAAECGWIVAEYGRQPWSIGEILPTHLSASSLSAGDVWSSLIAIFAFYTVLFIIEMYLMIYFVRKGPSSLGTGRYHFEQPSPSQEATQ